MKYLLSSWIILFLLIACAKENSTPTNDQNNDNGQNSDPLLTYVPDDNFEQALIDFGYDDVLDVDIRELFNPTKDAALLNGFVEYAGEVHRIQSEEDLQRLLDLIKEG